MWLFDGRCAKKSNGRGCHHGWVNPQQLDQRLKSHGNIPYQCHSHSFGNTVASTNTFHDTGSIPLTSFTPLDCPQGRGPLLTISFTGFPFWGHFFCNCTPKLVGVGWGGVWGGSGWIPVVINRKGLHELHLTSWERQYAHQIGRRPSH